MEIVYKNGWFQVIYEPTDSFYYVKQKDKVVVLPYLWDGTNLKLICLIEPIKIWGRNAELTAITGTIDEGESPQQSAPRELDEEVGLTLAYDDDNWTYLGVFNHDKGTQQKRHLFLVDVSSAVPHKKSTDGSKFEMNTKIIVGDESILSKSTDVHLHYMVQMLKQKLDEEYLNR